MLIVLYQKMISKEVGISTKMATRSLSLWIKEDLIMVAQKPIKRLMEWKKIQMRWVMLQAKEVLSNATKNVKNFLIINHLCKPMEKSLIKFPKNYVQNSKKKISMRVKETHKEMGALNLNSIIVVDHNRAKLSWIIMQSWTKRICK